MLMHASPPFALVGEGICDARRLVRRLHPERPDLSAKALGAVLAVEVANAVAKIIAPAFPPKSPPQANWFKGDAFVTAAGDLDRVTP
ncbi:hypothetical protein ACT9ST_04095 [Sphingobium limneticum]|jgi:hypothetical protein|uniref:hypothetical protein n=1 Tax=Sphingobium TaxID=165695 RepID=UPI0014781592|nr:hypothetical protein [Sphingobium limneticum]